MTTQSKKELIERLLKNQDESLEIALSGLLEDFGALEEGVSALGRIISSGDIDTIAKFATNRTDMTERLSKVSEIMGMIKTLAQTRESLREHLKEASKE